MEESEYPVERKPILIKNPYDKLIICMIKFLENRVDNLYQFLEDNEIEIETYINLRRNYLWNTLEQKRERYLMQVIL